MVTGKKTVPVLPPEEARRPAHFFAPPVGTDMGAGCGSPSAAVRPLPEAARTAPAGAPAGGPIQQARALLACLASNDALLRRLHRERQKTRRLWRRHSRSTYPAPVARVLGDGECRASGYMFDVGVGLAVIATSLLLGGCVRRWRARTPSETARHAPLAPPSGREARGRTTCSRG